MAEPPTYYAVIRERGPRWDPARPLREQEEWDLHASFMDGLAEEGVILRGGPLGGDDGALHIFAASGPEEIERRLAADPWEGTMLRNARIAHWQILLRAAGTSI
jgi:hypothetical protein